MRHVDLSLLADTLFTVQLVPGGGCHAVRNPSALDIQDVRRLAAIANEDERLDATFAAIQQLVPSAPMEEIRGLTPQKILRFMQAVAKAIDTVEEAAADDLPNGKAGTAAPSPIPAMPSATSFTESQPLPGAAYGTS